MHQIVSTPLQYSDENVEVQSVYVWNDGYSFFVAQTIGITQL